MALDVELAERREAAEEHQGVASRACPAEGQEGQVLGQMAEAFEARKIEDVYLEAVQKREVSQELEVWFQAVVPIHAQGHVRVGTQELGERGVLVRSQGL